MPGGQYRKITLGFGIVRPPCKQESDPYSDYQVIPMKYIIASFLLFTSMISMADQPENLPGNNGDNGNHFAYGKEGNNGITRRSEAIPEASTLALLALGLAGVIIVRIRKK